MAAEALVAAGVRVDLYDSMPSVGRKFLLAGKGGLNITHSEPFEAFVGRYGDAAERLRPLLSRFGPAELVAWVHALGVGTFVGTSGRVFPEQMKAAPLLRAWLHRLRSAGVVFHMRHRWVGWSDDGSLRFEAPSGEVLARPDAAVLALGGGSWARLGSDGAWVTRLAARGVRVSPLQPANCGFDALWSEHFSTRFAGHPLKAVALEFTGPDGVAHRRRGECVVTATGLEGSVVYAFSRWIREAIAAHGYADLRLDLSPERTEEALAVALARPRGSRSMANHLRARVGIEGVKAGLLRELLQRDVFDDPCRLAHAIKALTVRLHAARPLDEAISTAGGVTFVELDARLMLERLPGVFCAGEMLDWEAPTGGYLLTACLASGLAAGEGAAAWLARSGAERGAGLAPRDERTPHPQCRASPVSRVKEAWGAPAPRSAGDPR
ncbi:MAG: hypothetical protein RIS35_2636 [Pseudomonadota bacterium]|jgi:uncharacterized flavoprotein (TIGR03862 family)